MKKVIKKILNFIFNPIKYIANYTYTDKLVNLVNSKPFILVLLSLILSIVLTVFYILKWNTN
jgi:hypothetical protein